MKPSNATWNVEVGLPLREQRRIAALELSIKFLETTIPTSIEDVVETSKQFEHYIHYGSVEGTEEVLNDH